MVFVLIVTHKNEPTGEEFYLQELTSCLEYSLALNTQNVNNILGTNASRQTSQFKTYCRVREISSKDAGTKYYFRDPKKTED